MDIRDSLDIRNIQALHAQYAEDSVVIDLASHVAAISGLPGPTEASTNAGILRLRKSAARLARPTIIGLAILVLAGGAGMSAAKLWKVMHVTASPTVGVSASAADRALDGPAGQSASPRSSSQSDSQDAAPINAAPARPLTSADLASAPTASPLARVDVGNLLARSQTTSPGRAGSAASGAPGTQQAEVDARVAASPIRASSRLSSMEKQAGTAAATANAPATPDATPVAPAAPHAATAVSPGSASAVVVAASPTATERAAPASRPVTRPVRHAPVQRAAPKQEAHDDVASQVAPTRSPSSAGKGADVQLF